MHASELIAVLLFLAAVLGVYAATALLLVRSLRRARRGGPPAGRAERWARRILLTLAGVGIGCMLYGRFVEPYWPEVTRHRLASRKLPSGAGPVRIVQVSDLHCDPTVRLEDRLPNLVAAQRPDLIVFTGDAANSPGGLPVFRRCLRRLAALAPTFAVKGNWDFRPWAPADLFADTGARELDGEAVDLTVRGARLWIAGVSDWYQLDDVLAQAPPEAFSLLLYHYPVGAYKVADYRIDLTCCGHTHGGQVALPLYGALITLAHYGKRFEAGLYRVEDTALYVHRGIGMEGSLPRVRFGCRPEVAVFELVPE